MSRLPDHVIDDVRARIDIVDIVSEYVTLQRSGRRFKGLCPFHSEKSPSFHVNRETQLFYCFGCQAGGNVFNFLTEMEKAPFIDVVRRLAERVGIPIEEVEASPEEARRRRERAACLRANEIAKEYFIRCLFSREGSIAREYLKGRGLTVETVKAFEIGYAPPEWHGLHEYLRKRKVPEAVAAKAGLLGRGRRGLYDWFRDRIMFPIVDVNAQVVGFGGRTLGKDGAKYVNTPEAPLFSKGHHLYGLNVAKAGARKFDHVLLVEGYMDVVGLYQHGYGPAVASLGTAFTKEQGRLLKRFSSEIVLAYDADVAGQNAARRGLDILAEEGLTVRVARLPEGHDPDSYIGEYGRDAFLRIVEAAVPLVEYKLDQAVQGINLSSVEGQIEGVRRVLPVLSAIEGAVGREGYMAHAVGLLGVSTGALTEELAKYERSGSAGRGSVHFSRSRHNLSRSRYTNRDLPVKGYDPSVNGKKEQGASNENSFSTLESALIAWLLREPDQISVVRAALGDSPFREMRFNKIFAWLLEQPSLSRDVAETVGRINDPQLANIAGEILVREEVPAVPFEAYLKKAVEERLRRQMRSLEKELSLLMRSDRVSLEDVGNLVLSYKKIRDRLQSLVRAA